jgi:uncharacterized protein YcfJ
MNIRPWFATISSFVVVSLAFAATSSEAAEYRRVSNRHSGPVYDYARVLSAEPIVRYVTVTTPVKECWDDVEYYTVDRRTPGTAGSTLFGAIIGGVIGHQFGGGRGNDVATALGSVVGAAIGNSSAKRAQAYNGYRSTRYSRPVTHCKTNYRSREEERIDGYDVVYRYNGQKYATRTRHDPGSRLRIRVDVRPAE